MPERVLIDLPTIVTATDHRTVSVDDDGPDGNVVMLLGQSRLGEGQVHPVPEAAMGTEAELRTLLL
ncbi:hypothetical protein GCM10009813_33330 [Brevibacterium marinum]